MLARRGMTGELVVDSDGRQYRLALVRGYVVAAHSPAMADRAAAVALESDVITPADADVVDRWLAAIPDADEVEICANVAMLSAADAHRLRRRTIARRAARILSLEHGEFSFEQHITLPVVADCEMHVGGVIYVAARTLIFPHRLHALVESLGNRYELHHEATGDLADYGFGERERPTIEALATGVSLYTLQQRPEHERSIAYATIYALASCGALYCEATPPRLARGTQNPLRRSALDLEPPPADPLDAKAMHEAMVLATEPLEKSTAADAFDRGQRALRAGRVTDAILELELAVRLGADEPTHLAALAWARFCAAPDKPSIANETRRLLGHAIEHAQTDAIVQPLYYLGLVERILNRPEQAAVHFREVLELEPRHAEAATELRFLARR